MWGYQSSCGGVPIHPPSWMPVTFLDATLGDTYWPLLATVTGRVAHTTCVCILHNKHILDMDHNPVVPLRYYLSSFQTKCHPFLIAIPLCTPNPRYENSSVSIPSHHRHESPPQNSRLLSSLRNSTGFQGLLKVDSSEENQQRMRHLLKGQVRSVNHYLWRSWNYSCCIVWKHGKNFHINNYRYVQKVML